jgi:hypothetical protein
MHRFVSGAAIVLAGIASGCELVAGIHDKVLIADQADATTIGDSAAVAPRESGEPPADASADALPGTDDAPPDDAPAQDATSGDADAVAPDGNFLAPDAGAMDPSAPCSQQTQALFCDDFDHESAFTQNWSYQLASDDGGAMSFFSGAYTSAPRSLQIVAPASTGSPQLSLGKTFGSFNAQLRLAFDLRIDVDDLSTVPTTAIAQILGGRTGVNMQINYLLHPGSTELQTYLSLDGGAGRSVTLPMLPLKQSVRIVVSYDPTAGVAVYEDGREVGSDATATGGAPGPTQFQIGMVYQTPPGSGTITYEIDNVVFNAL